MSDTGSNVAVLKKAGGRQCFPPPALPPNRQGLAADVHGAVAAQCCAATELGAPQAQSAAHMPQGSTDGSPSYARSCPLTRGVATAFLLRPSAPQRTLAHAPSPCRAIAIPIGGARTSFFSPACAGADPSWAAGSRHEDHGQAAPAVGAHVDVFLIWNKSENYGDRYSQARENLSSGLGRLPSPAINTCQTLGPAYQLLSSSPREPRGSFPRSSASSLAPEAPTGASVRDAHTPESGHAGRVSLQSRYPGTAKVSVWPTSAPLRLTLSQSASFTSDTS